MPPDDAPVVFLSLPVSCTGDLWHHATAQFLHSLYRLAKSFRLVTLFAAIDEERDFHRSLIRAPSVFNYFLEIGQPCVLARISFPRGGEADFGEAILYGDKSQYMGLLEAQQQQQHRDRFEVLWPKLKAINTQMDEESDRPRDSGILHYYLSTTVAMQSLSFDLSRKERAARLCKLGDALSKAEKLIDDEVDRKCAELMSLVKKKRLAQAPRYAEARVLLYNWRGPSTYSGHASLDSHHSQIEEQARSHGLLVIRVAAGVVPPEILDTDLDLFDARVSDTIRDKRFTPRFWSRVRDMPDIFGLVGGRSGSVDVAAFVGVNCFQWDEPVFDVAAADHEALAAKPGHLLPPAEYVEMQVPQFLRLMNQCSIMNVGLLDVDSYDTETGVFTRLVPEELDRWLSGEVEVHPRFPGTEKAMEVLVRYIKQIEAPSFGISAVNLRKVWIGGPPGKTHHDIE